MKSGPQGVMSFLRKETGPQKVSRGGNQNLEDKVVFEEGIRTSKIGAP